MALGLYCVNSQKIMISRRKSESLSSLGLPFRRFWLENLHALLFIVIIVISLQYLKIAIPPKLRCSLFIGA